jgi:hypothetical protein
MMWAELQVLPSIYLEENRTASARILKRSASEDLRIVLYYDESVYRCEFRSFFHHKEEQDNAFSEVKYMNYEQVPY